MSITETFVREPLLRFTVAMMSKTAIVGWQKTARAPGVPSSLRWKYQNITGEKVTSEVPPQFGTETTPYCWSAVSGSNETFPGHPSKEVAWMVKF